MRSLLMIGLCAASCCGVFAGRAMPDESQPVREIYVPAADLDLLLEGAAERVLVSRQEYRNLLALTKPAEAPAAPPRDAVLLEAEYSIAMAGEQAFVRGSLDIELLTPGLHAVPLDVARVALLTVSLDGADAALGRGDDGQLMLFAEGQGRHTLTLAATTRIEASAAQQSVSFRVPVAAATQLRLTVPGNVEMRSPVLSRRFDDAAGETQFELPVHGSEQRFVMSLNNRDTASEQVVQASSVIVDEVSETVERLHATLTMRVLRGAVDLFRFRLPAGFELTEVSAPQVARWGVVDAADGQSRVLEVWLHEPTTESVSLVVTALSAEGDAARSLLGDWVMPRVEPLDVASHTSVLGLLLDERLKAAAFATDRMIPIDTSVLDQILPPRLPQAEPGAAPLRAVAAWLATDPRAMVRSTFSRPDTAVEVSTAALVTLHDAELRLRTSISLAPRVDPLFAVKIRLPAGWNVSGITTASDTPLAFAPLVGSDKDRGSGVRVRFPTAVPAGSVERLALEASYVPDGWLDAWSETSVQFPEVEIDGATRGEAAIAITAADDLAVRAERIEGLIPLTRSELEGLGLSADDGTFAYRLAGPAGDARFLATRKTPELTARSISFFRIDHEVVSTHAELLYDIRRAAADSLSFSLPASTPQTITLRGLGGARVTEFSSREADGQRIWTARLADRTRGQAGLAIDFEEPMLLRDITELELPCVVAEEVSYQSAAVAVEGNPQVSVTLATNGRPIDVGELVDAEAEVGRRLLGAYGFAGTPRVTAAIERRPGFGLPTAIIQRAALVTLQGVNGASQTAARFFLRTNASFLQVALPSGANLWSVTIDGRAALPQRDGEDLLVSLPSQAADAVLRDVTIVYETPSASFDWIGQVVEEPPQLTIRNEGSDAGVAVPLADVEWQLLLPDGYRMVRSGGNVAAVPDAGRPWSLMMPLRLLAQLGGGIEAVGWSSPFLQRLLPQAQSPLLLAERKSAFDTDARGLAGTEFPAKPAAAPASPAASGLGDKEEQAGDEAPDRKDQHPRDAIAGLRAISPKSDAADDPEAAAVDTLQAETVPGGGARETGAWALEGVRSLPIQLTEEGTRVSFVSLGGQPQLTATLVQESRLLFATIGVAVLVIACGLMVARCGWRARRRLVAALVMITLAAPIALELLADLELHDVFLPGFLIATVLLPGYAVIDAVRWAAHRRPSPTVNHVVANVLLGIAFVAAEGDAVAQEPGQSMDTQAILEIFEQLDRRPSLRLPDDAVIIPYGADDGDMAADAGVDAANGLPSESQLSAADTVLVPYADYLRLKARAEGDDVQMAAEVPAPFAFAGASYNTRLEESGELVVRGQLQLEVYATSRVEVPLLLEGGVLERAVLDGQAALLRLVEPAEPPAGQQNALQQAAVPPEVEPRLLLTVEGTGRHQLELLIRMPVEQRGGWRSFRGRLPTAAAARLSLTVPTPQTELRLTAVDGTVTRQTQQPDEVVDAAVDADAFLSVAWRSQVSAARVDEALTARSLAVVDVREDGVHAAWQFDLDVRQGQREAFAFTVPEGWLVEGVEGPQIRGWEVRRRNAPGAAEDTSVQKIDVALLEPISGQVQLWVRLSRQVDLLFDEVTALRLVAVGVPEAVLHQGFLVIRRGPLVELRTAQADGLVRDDPPAELLAAALARSPDESPLAVQAFQAYRFVNESFELLVDPRPLQTRLVVDTQTLLRVGDRESTFEARLACSIEGRPLHRLRVDLPEGVTLKDVSCPGLSGWTLFEGDQRQLVIDLTTGAAGAWSAAITGSLASEPTVAAPPFAVPDATRQTQTLVVQADPSISVEVTRLDNAEKIPLPQTFGWLAAEQRQLARLALFARGPVFEADFKVSKRQPVVTAVGLTNVRATPRELAETVLLKFQIMEAGIRELSFLLPESWKAAEVHVPLLLEKTVEPVDEQPGMVRFRLRLQDDVIGTLVVLVDRTGPLGEESHTVAVPQIETGTTTHRFVVLENRSRDEMAVAERVGIRELSRQQAAWEELASILPGTATEAYVVAADADEPRLVVALRSRSLVESVGARIGLALTTLSVDGGGVYRGTQEYRIDNRTEQLLEVQLPEGAALWSAVVAGEPVKPAVIEEGNTRRVGIPLIKTQAGDLDYPVVLTYGGTLGPLGRQSSLRFPFLKTNTINVEQSLVRLWLPETHRWFGFNGTLRQTQDSDELAADYLAYQNKKLQQLMQVASSESQDVFSRVRARTNAAQLGASLQGYVDSVGNSASTSGTNERLQRELMANSMIVEEAQQQAGQNAAEADAADAGNTGQLWAFFAGQEVARGTNVVNELDRNFDSSGQAFESKNAVAAESRTVQGEPAGAAGLNRRWVDGNQFGRGAAADEKRDGVASSGEGRVPAKGMVGPAATAEQQSPRVDFGDIEKKRWFDLGAGPANGPGEPPSQQQSADLQAQVQRYQMRLEQSAAGGQAVLPEPPVSGQAFGGRVGGGMSAEGEQADMFRGGLSAGLLEDRSDRLSGGMGGIGGGGGVAFGSGSLPPSSTVSGFAREAGRADHGNRVDQPPASGLASLEVAIPTRGREFLFTTPRGELVITAEAFDARLADRAARLGLVVAALIGVWLVWWMAASAWRGLGPRLGGGLLILAGLGSMLTLTLPVVGIAMVACGVVAVVRGLPRRCLRTSAASAGA